MPPPKTKRARRSPEDPHPIRIDPGDDVNHRLIKRLLDENQRHIEAPHMKLPAMLCSPEAKRFFLRNFQPFQAHAYFVSVIARTKLPGSQVKPFEDELRDSITQGTAIIDQLMEELQHLYTARGINRPVGYDSYPMNLDISVICALGRRYLALIEKFDQALPLLNALAVQEILQSDDVSERHKAIKRATTKPSLRAREARSELQKEIERVRAARFPRPDVGQATAQGEQAAEEKLDKADIDE